MHILVIGLNYKTAPVEIREKLSFDEAELAKAMKILKDKKIVENVIVSTCNRTEIYAVGNQIHTSERYIKDFLAEWFQIDQEEFSPYLFTYEGNGAVEHLFQVTCGLNSMVLGETQILGQVRTSYLLAQEEKTIGTIFNHQFKEALRLAKKAHTETQINTNSVSASYAAVKLTKKIFGRLNNKNVLILGAGKTGELAIQNFHEYGVNNFTVINRTFEKANALAERFSGKAATLQELQKSLVETDILITSTSSKNFVITKEMMKEVNKKRKDRPLVMIDMAIPRDIDPTITETENVFLYNIDDLQGVVESNIAERKKAAEKINLMINDEVSEFNQWFNLLDIIPIISALREKAVSIQVQTMDSIDRKLPHLSTHDKKLISKHIKSIINQLLKDPIRYAKEITDEPNTKEAVNQFLKIFQIKDFVKSNVELAEKEKISNRKETNSLNV